VEIGREWWIYGEIYVQEVGGVDAGGEHGFHRGKEGVFSYLEKSGSV